MSAGTRRSLAGSALALAAGLALSSALMALLVSGSRAAIEETVRAALPVGVLWLAATHVAVRWRYTGAFRVQYALAAAGTVVVALGAVLWMAQQMFTEAHDAAMLASLVAFAAVVGARTADVLAARSSREVARVREGLNAIAAGDLARRVEPSGPDEIASLARAANAMAARLEAARDERDAADRARRNLVVSVSHDLRTPLASLRLLVEGVQDGVLAEPSEVARALDGIGTHVRSLSALVDDLFELARLDAGEITWSLVRIAVDELFDETLEAFQPQAERKRLRLARDIGGPVGSVTGNPEQLQRVLYNLVQNAVRHTPADGTVTLRAEPADRFVLIEVADDGDGMSPAEADRAFERFFRGAQSRAGGGAGLGLSICRAIVEAHGGRIWIEPGRPRGTRVRFTVPASG